MASMAKVTVIGYLGRDPEMRYTDKGTPVCDFSVAHTEKYTNRDGDEVEETYWYKATCWNKLAELAEQYLEKGRQVYIEGRLRVEEWEDNEGNPRWTLAVTVSQLLFLGSGQDSSGERPSKTSKVTKGGGSKKKAQQEPPSRGKAKAKARKSEPVSESDIPF